MMMMMVRWKKHHLLSLLTAGADQLDHGISTFVTTLVALLEVCRSHAIGKILTFWGGIAIAISSANVRDRGPASSLSKGHANIAMLLAIRVGI